MDFWKVYEAEMAEPEFGKGGLRIASRERINLSLSSVERYGTLLGLNQGTTRRFSEERRYTLLKDLTHDMFISLYDVNTTQTFLLRFSEELGDAAIRKVAGDIRKINKPNLEMRAIGLQDNDTELLGSLQSLHAALKPSLMEADLFGRETRHIVFDLKLGMSFNLLLLNRIYRPHELVNTTRLEEFNKKKSELEFV